MLTDFIACGVRFHRYLALFLCDKTHKCLILAPTKWYSGLTIFFLFICRGLLKVFVSKLHYLVHFRESLYQM